MSLIICGNKPTDSLDDDGLGIGSAFSFRNDLASTLTIPKNSKIGLQSVKIQTNGNQVIDTTSVASQFFGEVITGGDVNLDASTSIPMRWNLVNNERLTTETFQGTPEEMASRLTKTCNQTIWHPNLAQQAVVSTIRDGTTNAMIGYDITYGQDEGTATHIPGAGQVYDAEWGDFDPEFGITSEYIEERFKYPGGDSAVLGWDYAVVGASGMFNSTAHNKREDNDQVNMIATEFPISLMGGELLVDFKSPNASGLNWMAGLTRFNRGLDEPMPAPSYFDINRSNSDAGLWCASYFDVGVVAYEGGLALINVGMDATDGEEKTEPIEIQYWNNANSDFNALSDRYDITTNASNLEKVKFQVNGQQVKVIMVDDRDAEFVLYQYDASYTKSANLFPLSQCKWTLLPTLAMETTDTLFNNQMYIEDYTPCKGVGVLQGGTRVGYRVDDGDLPVDSLAGWWDSELSRGSEEQGREIETRPWNDLDEAEVINPFMRAPTSGTNRRLGKGTTPSYQNVIFTAENDDYGVTDAGATNSSDILGFSVSPLLTFTEVGTGASDFSVKFTSDASVPTQFGSKSVFVRVGGLSQRSMNAYAKNTSTIIGHFPLFDGQASTGRLFFEPNEITYLDLNNAYDIRVSSLDISFCYIDETFADVLSGQSVVVLHLLQKE